LSRAHLDLSKFDEKIHLKKERWFDEKNPIKKIKKGGVPTSV
jgi:hypothetical protein